MEGKNLVDAWRGIINGPEKSWVLFENGTCVILMEPQGDLAAQATELLREWGSVHVGSSFGDFSAIELQGGQTTLRGVAPEINANLGRGCEPELHACLALLREGTG